MPKYECNPSPALLFEDNLVGQSRVVQYVQIILRGYERSCNRF